MKNIIITGGSGLIGQQIVKKLLDQEFRVINFDIEDFTITNHNYYFIKTDITNINEVDISLDQVKNKFGTFYGLVNNAYPRTNDWSKPFPEIKYESWKKNIDIQLNSAFYIIQKVCEELKANKIGSIVNIASIYGVVGNDMTVYQGTGINPPAAYSAIKGGLINFTRFLASYYGEYNLRINCISPGGIFDNQDEVFVKNYCAKVPMRRMGLPEDISPAVHFLLSEDSTYITGQNLIIDGGWTAI